MARKSKKFKWHFAPSGGGEIVGFNEGDTTIYRGDTVYYVTREPIQNVIDVPIKEPVKIHFSLLKTKCDLLPGMDYLSKTFKACADYFSKKMIYDKDCIRFFKSAAKKIDRNEEIGILKISDTNTEGLTESNYFKFMRAVGVCGKSATKGGSFGLGKGAYFAASQFRTIFVSSCYKENGKMNYLFEGKSRLVSFEENNKTMQSNGRYGISLKDGDSTYVSDPEVIPDLFKRTEQGTSFFILDFDLGDNWDGEILKQVLINFWLRILEGRLEVTVNETTVNKENLKDIIYDHFCDIKYNSLHQDNPIPFYEAYTDLSSKFFEDRLESIGHVILRVLQKEDFPKQINYFRNTGMRVENKTHRSPVNFAGVFVCDDDKGAKILRGMENPQHNEWSPKNAKDGKPSDKEKNAIRDIHRFIKESLSKLIEGESKPRFTIKGTENYLNIPMEEEDLIDSQEEGDAKESAKEKETASETTVQQSVALGELKDTDKKRFLKINIISEGDQKGTRKIDRKTTNVVVDSDGSHKLKQIQNLKFRSFAQRDESGILHTIILRGTPQKKLVKTLIYVGMDEGFDEVDIVEARNVDTNNNYSVRDNSIHGIVLNEGGKATINLRLNSSEKHSLNVIAYENI